MIDGGDRFILKLRLIFQDPDELGEMDGGGGCIGGRKNTPLLMVSVSDFCESLNSSGSPLLGKQLAGNRIFSGTPLQYSCLENPTDGGAWWAAVHGVAQSRTRLSEFTFTFHFHDWRRKWQSTPVFLPGESQGRGSLVGCCLWGGTESDMTEVT